jgi:hypothetical protein
MGAPTVQQIARDHRGPLPLAAARRYAASLPPSEQKAKTGCYIVRCVCCGAENCCCGSGLPVACLYNLSCSGCLWPGIGTIPFGCLIILNNRGTPQYYNGSYSDGRIVVKVDAEKDTLAYYEGTEDSNSPWCYCVWVGER